MTELTVVLLSAVKVLYRRIRNQPKRDNDLIVDLSHSSGRSCFGTSARNIWN